VGRMIRAKLGEMVRPVRGYWSRLPRAKKRWLLPLVLTSGVIAAIAAIPFLLIAMMIGTCLLSIVAGPVNVWNTSWRTPSVSELAGEYRLSEKRLPGQLPSGFSISERSGFRLGADRRLEVTELPGFDGFGQPSNCTYNGTGTWSTSEGGGVKLYLNIEESVPPRTGNPPSCAPISLAFASLSDPVQHRRSGQRRGADLCPRRQVTSRRPGAA
jgi:hypothetical protein